jgi:hypothetical protein
MRLINTYLKNEFVSNLLPKTGSSGRSACGSVLMSRAAISPFASDTCWTVRSGCMTTMLIDTNPTPSGDSIPSSKPDGVDPGSEVMTDQISKAFRAAVLLNRHQDEIAAVWAEMADNLPEANSLSKRFRGQAQDV